MNTNTRRFPMKMKILAILCSTALLLGAAACKKKEEQPVPETGAHTQKFPTQVPQPGAPGQNVVVPKGETNIVVPDSVKGNWKAVVLEVKDKSTNKAAEYTVDLNSEFTVPESDITLVIGDFLPDFRMEGLSLTSASDQPNNPAVGVRIMEKGEQIFPAQGKKWGWLYARPEFRTMHPFEHAKYSISLLKGVKKG
jgi:hypothetical protein